MTNTKDGAKRAAETQKQKYGDNHHAEIGALGGAKTKGRKVSAETRRKLSEKLKAYNAARRSSEDNQTHA